MLRISGKNATEVKSPSCHMVSGVHAVIKDINPEQLVEMVCARFLHCKCKCCEGESLMSTSTQGEGH